MRGHIQKYGGKKGTCWMVQYYLGYDSMGRKRYTTKRRSKTKKDAERFLAEITQDMHDGVYVDPSKEYFSDYLIRWIDYKRGFVRPRTCEIYARTLRLHVSPRLGRVPLNELKPFHLRDLYTYLQRNKQLSTRYIGQIRTMLHDALDRALKWELVPRNVADHVQAPPPERTRFSVWSIEDVRRFLSAPEVSEHRFYVAVLLALTTDMRQGEIWGLKWSDIDFDNATIEVRRPVTYLNGKPVFGPPKSESWERVITVEALRQHQVRQNHDRLLMGASYNNQDLVVARLNGNVVIQTFIRAKFTQLIKQLDMPYIRFHDIRHTFVHAFGTRRKPKDFAGETQP